MILTLERRWFSSEATLGELFVNGVFECFTLEDVVRSAKAAKVPGATAIPEGSYDVVVNYSQRFKRRMPLLLSVPGFSGVRIHSGNTDADTEGCVLVGCCKLGDDLIGESRKAFEQLFAKIDAAFSVKPPDLPTIRLVIKNNAPYRYTDNTAPAAAV